MKRRHDQGVPLRTGILRVDLTKEQLVNIGLVAMTYNEAEARVGVVLSSLMGFTPEESFEVLSRMGGIEDCVGLIQFKFRVLCAPKSLQTLVSQTFGSDAKSGFSQLKSYRNCIIHAQVHNASLGIAKTPGKKGKTYDTLLTVEALNAVVIRLEHMINELSELSNIGLVLREFSKKQQLQIEPTILSAMTNYKQYQENRLALTPLPEFPSQTEVMDSHLRWHANQLPPFGWFQQWEMPRSSRQSTAHMSQGITNAVPPLQEVTLRKR